MTRKRNSILDGTAVVLAASLGTAVATAAAGGAPGAASPK